MSLRFALLGLLNERPASGYDLTRRFAQGIGSYAWDAKHSQIYPELKKLTEAGLIEIAEEGARGRKTYAITADGRAQLRQWLLTPAGNAGVRNEYVLRLFLLSALRRDEARTILEHTIEYSTEQLQAITQDFQDSVADGGPTRGHGALAAQYGIRVFQATIDWAHWAIEQIDADPGFGHGADGCATAPTR
ncbi:PadR family transcriptional regulator [Microlunatus sp. Gsoil 973]|uniref:PadR family transcriptional regulator n=1 Tax=Microlunatus sp. Gsoil 973 TaxID=2672569 RepID=UPI0012B4657E|nr:PadR family transcriptional regulator [Microlunatus sp. Gsoil 973]QGN33340.1 PadR family transcriptional regulator [Microlunatus sp. Gsoil 973]